MQTFWLGIAGVPSPDQRERLGAAGLVEKGVGGEAFSRMIHHTYFLIDAPTDDAAVEQVAEILPELRQEWERKPPHLIYVKESI